MTSDESSDRVVSASRDIEASAQRIFDLIADPARQASWDGNDNLSGAPPGQRVHAVGDVFTMSLTNGAVRENHVVEFVEGHQIAWRPSEPGKKTPGHLWRWELSPLSNIRTAVTHTYDWTALTDEERLARARATTADKLRASLDRLAALAEAPQREITPGLAAQLSGSSYHGLATFAQRPFLTEVEQLEAWRPDVAVVGAPFDISTTNRPGARFGPRAIRANAYEPGTYHMDLGLDFVDWLEVVDFGDAHCPHGLTEVSHANIREHVHTVASRGIVPIILGGDHSITWPAATAVADVHGYGNVGIVHFDAHADTADIIDGNLASHGTPMRRLIESGAVPGTHFVQVGLRGYWPPQDTFQWMLEQGMTWHTMQEIWERGFKDVMREAVSEALAKAEKLYVSVDIDVLDPAHAPGTGTPEPGGITSADLLRMVRQLCHEHDVVGVDVVEVAPAYDHAELTVNAAHRVVLEALSGMAARRRDAAGAPKGPPAR